MAVVTVGHGPKFWFEKLRFSARRGCEPALVEAQAQIGKEFCFRQELLIQKWFWKGERGVGFQIKRMSDGSA